MKVFFAECKCGKTVKLADQPYNDRWTQLEAIERGVCADEARRKPTCDQNRYSS